MRFIKQSTAVTLLLGPFVDETDGFSPETGLTITSSSVLLSKNSGALTAKNESSSLSHNANGMYDCVLNTTDTNTLGVLVISIDASGARLVTHEFMVLEALVYDKMIAGYKDYEDSAVWFDDYISNTGTTPYVDGVYDNPVSTWGAVASLLTAIGLRRVHVKGYGYPTLTANNDGLEIIGESADFNLATYTLDTCFLKGLRITGSGGTLEECRIEHGIIYTGVTLDNCFLFACNVAQDFAIGTASRLHFLDCVFGENPADIPIMTFHASSATDVYMKGFGGELELASMKATDNLIIEGNGKLIIGASCVGGTITIGGSIAITDNSGGAVTIVNQNTDIQFYEAGAIWLDDWISNTNTVPYVDGTADNPVSAWASALILDASLGFRKFIIKGYVTPTATANLQGYEIYGNDGDFIFASFDIDKCYLEGLVIASTACTISLSKLSKVKLNQGFTLDDDNEFYDCVFVNDFALDSGIINHFHNCIFGSNPADVPIMTFHASGQNDLHMNGFAGSLELASMKSADSLHISGGGTLIIGASCAGGTITVSGDISITDNASGAVTVVRNEVTESYGDAVYVSEDYGVAGTAYPIGTANNPSNTIANAVTIATANNIKKIIITDGSFSGAEVPASVAGYVVEGYSQIAVVITFSSTNVNEAVFRNVAISGTVVGIATYFDCTWNNNMTACGFFYNCSMLSNTVTLDPSFLTVFKNLVVMASMTLDFSGGGCTGGAELVFGPLTLTNMSAGDTFIITSNGGAVTIDASCTGGTVNITGDCEITDNSGGAVTLVTNLVRGKVWDELLADHTVVGSTGEGLSSAGGGSTPGAIADAVLDELLSGHTTPGSLGEVVSGIDSKVDIIDTNVDSSLVNQASIEGKIDIVDGNVDTALVNQGTIEGKVDTALVNQGTIEGKVDIVDSNVDTSLTNQGVMDGKLDTLIAEPSAPTSEEVADAVWDELLTGLTHNIPTSAGRILRSISVASAIILESTAVSATINTITLDGGSSDSDGAYDPAMISIVAGTGAGQTRGILEYSGATHTAIVDRDWKVIPDNTSDFVIVGWPGREHVNEGKAQGGSGNTITLNALASSITDAYKGQLVFLRSGTGEDQVGLITAYNGTTKVATIQGSWGVVPDSTTGYIMVVAKTPNTADLSALISSLVPTAEEITDAVWDELIDSHVISGSMAVVMKDLIKLNGNRVTRSGTQITIYEDDGTTPWRVYELAGDGRAVV